MSPKRLAKPLAYACLGLLGGVLGHRNLHVFSHMRAGSSLLTHILVTNDAIRGFGEAHIRYRTRRDLLLLRRREMKENGSQPFAPPGTFYMDKLLHGYCLADGCEDIYSGHDRVLFLLRNPLDTILSIQRMKGMERFRGDIPASAAYYKARMKELMRHARAFAGQDTVRPGFLRYEDLLDDPDATLAALTGFLGLSEPLSKEYRLMPTTGVKGYGDRSENIVAGVIHKRKRPREYPPELEAMRAELEDIHDEAVAYMASRFFCAGSGPELRNGLHGESA